MGLEQSLMRCTIGSRIWKNWPGEEPGDMNFGERMRRIGMVAGLAGGAVGAFFSSLANSADLLAKRDSYNEFRKLVPTRLVRQIATASLTPFYQVG